MENLKYIVKKTTGAFFVYCFAVVLAIILIPISLFVSIIYKIILISLSIFVLYTIYGLTRNTASMADIEITADRIFFIINPMKLFWSIGLNKEYNYQNIKFILCYFKKEDKDIFYGLYLMNETRDKVVYIISGKSEIEEIVKGLNSVGQKIEFVDKTNILSERQKRLFEK